MGAKHEYIKKELYKTGVSFQGIPKTELIMTCSNYNGIISKANYKEIINVVNEIYEEGTYKECM